MQDSGALHARHAGRIADADCNCTARLLGWEAPQRPVAGDLVVVALEEALEQPVRFAMLAPLRLPRAQASPFSSAAGFA